MDVLDLFIKRVNDFLAKIKELYAYVVSNYLPTEEDLKNKHGFEFFW